MDDSRYKEGNFLKEKGRIFEFKELGIISPLGGRFYNFHNKPEKNHAPDDARAEGEPNISGRNGWGTSVYHNLWGWSRSRLHDGHEESPIQGVALVFPEALGVRLGIEAAPRGLQVLRYNAIM